MSPLRRVRLGLLLLGIILVVGTIGFVVIDGANVFDAFYMVAITVTTVGFQEVFELSTPGRVWAIVIIASGFGIAFYTATATIEYLVDLGEFRHRNRMLKRINAMSGHVIVCGFGRVGRAIYANLDAAGSDLVVIERHDESSALAEGMGASVVHGDATHDDILESAGVERASALIACVDTDSDNLVIALSAKSIKPGLRVICRATEIESERKLLLAGADAVVTPQAVGAERLAALAVQPELAQIFDVVVNGRPVEFHVEELDVQPGCVVDGQSIRDCGIRQDSGATILAVEDQKVEMKVNPDPGQVLVAGDRLVVVGTKEQVDRAAQLLTKP